MNKREHLWTIFQEECAELIQQVSKIKRFGLTHTHPVLGKLNLELLNDELNDLFAVAELLEEEGIPLVASRKKIDAKKKKVEHFLEVSRGVNTLK